MGIEATEYDTCSSENDTHTHSYDSYIYIIYTHIYIYISPFINRVKRQFYWASDESSVHGMGYPIGFVHPTLRFPTNFWDRAAKFLGVSSHHHWLVDSFAGTQKLLISSWKDKLYPWTLFGLPGLPSTTHSEYLWMVSQGTSQGPKMRHFAISVRHPWALTWMLRSWASGLQADGHDLYCCIEWYM